MKQEDKRTIADLQKELNESKRIIKNLKYESLTLKKAIWDMLNYANMYVMLLDSEMIVRLINWSLATELGFKNEKEVIGKSWIEFIPDGYKDLFKVVHSCLILEKTDKYREMINEVQRINGTSFLVKWFNVQTDSQYNMIFSMGLRTKTQTDSVIVSEDSIRSYYRDIIEKDRTMIQSLRDVVIKGMECKE